ncbi:hypothetical protein THAOC_17960, partial [Thalassiosira oceanica]
MTSTPARPQTCAEHYGQPPDVIDYLTADGTPNAFASLNVIDAATAPAPAAIRDQLAAAAAAGRHVSAMLFHAGSNEAVIYHGLSKFGVPLGGTENTEYHDKMIAEEGDLVAGIPYTVSIQDSALNRQATSVRILNPTALVAHLAANPGDQWMDPVPDTEAESVEVQFRQLTFIPPKYEAAVEANPTSPLYYTNVFPMVQTNGDEAMMAGVTQAFALRFTRTTAGTDSSAIQVGTVPARLPRSALALRASHVNRLLPGRVGTPASSAGGGGVTTAEFLDRLDAREESRLRREEEREQKKKSPAAVFGGLASEKLLDLMGYESWDHVPEDHIYKVLLKCNKSEWRNNLQSKLEALAKAEHYLGLKITVSDNDLKALVSGNWTVLSPAFLSTSDGVLTVPFRYNAVDIAQAQKIMKTNLQHDLINSHGARPSLDDATELSKVDIALPSKQDYLDQLRRFKLIIMAALP